MEKTHYASSIRFTKEDHEMIEYLMKRLGMKSTQVLRLALRRLYQAEKKLDR
jgi:predicted DNA-binding protein